MTPQLLTIRISHYNEKARWALDRCGLAYEERAYMPVLHMAGTIPLLLRRRAGRADRVSTRFSTPVLITKDRVLADSCEILAYASEQSGLDLYPNDEARELEARFGAQLGADTRRLVYWYLLPERGLLGEFAQHNVGPTQARLFRAGEPIIVKVLRRALAVEEARAMRSREAVIAEFEAVSAMLADGRPYLTGERFTAADLSFAALGSIAIMVGSDEGYGAWMPARERLPPDFAALVEQLRATAAGQFILRMFADERRRS